MVVVHHFERASMDVGYGVDLDVVHASSDEEGGGEGNLSVLERRRRAKQSTTSEDMDRDPTKANQDVANGRAKKKARKGTAELRALSFWSWDKRVEEHPPGRAYRADTRDKEKDRDRREEEDSAPRRDHSNQAKQSLCEEQREKGNKRKARRKSEADRLRVWAWDPLVDKYPPGTAYSAQKPCDEKAQQPQLEDTASQDSEDSLPLERLVEIQIMQTMEGNDSGQKVGMQATERETGEVLDEHRLPCADMSARERYSPGSGNMGGSLMKSSLVDEVKRTSSKCEWDSRLEHLRIDQELQRANIAPAGEGAVPLTKTREYTGPPPVEIPDSDDEVPLRAVLEQFQEEEVACSPVERFVYEDTGVELDGNENRMLQSPSTQRRNQDVSIQDSSFRKHDRLQRRRHLILDDSEPKTTSKSLPDADVVHLQSAGHIQEIHASESQEVVGSEENPSSHRIGTFEPAEISREDPSTSSEPGGFITTRPVRQQNVHFISGDPTRGVTEVYTSTHAQRLGSYAKPWELNIDGCDGYGEKIYDDVDGLTCHQCRQKTLARVTICRCCGMEAHQFCGDCLWRRYGENLDEALENPTWHCPVCRDICNCSLCRAHKGWPSTGQLYRKAMRMGYASVAHYLVLTRMHPVDSSAAPVAVQLPEIDARHITRRRSYTRRRQKNQTRNMRDLAEAGKELGSQESASTCKEDDEEENEEDLQFLRSDNEDLSEHSASSLERTRQRIIEIDHSNRSPDWKETLQMLRRKSAKGGSSGEAFASEEEHTSEGGELSSEESEENDFVRGDTDNISEHSDNSHERTRGPKLQFQANDPSSHADSRDLPPRRSRRAVAKLPFSRTSIPQLLRQHNNARLNSEDTMQEHEVQSDSSGAVHLTKLNHRSRHQGLGSTQRDEEMRDAHVRSRPDSRSYPTSVHNRTSRRRGARARRPTLAGLGDSVPPVFQEQAQPYRRRRRRKRQLHLDNFLANGNDIVDFFSDGAKQQENMTQRNISEPPGHTESLASFATRKPTLAATSYRRNNRTPLLIIDTNLFEASIKYITNKAQRIKSGSLPVASTVMTPSNTLEWLLTKTLGQDHGQEVPPPTEVEPMVSPSVNEQSVELPCQKQVQSQAEGDSSSHLHGDISPLVPRGSQSHAPDTKNDLVGANSPEVLLQTYEKWPRHDKHKLLRALLSSFEHHSTALNSGSEILVLPPIEMALWNHVVWQFSTLQEFWCETDAALVEREAQKKTADGCNPLQSVEFQWEAVSFLASTIYLISDDTAGNSAAGRNWSIVHRLLKESVDCGSPRSHHSELEILLTHRCRQLTKYWGSDTTNLLLLWDIIQCHAGTPSGCRCCAVDAVSWPTNASIAIEELSHMDQVFLDQRSPCGIFFQMLREHLARKNGSSLLREASKWMALFPKTPSIVHSVVPRIKHLSSSARHMTPASLQHYAQLVILLHHFLPRSQGRKLLKIFHGLIVFQYSSPRACRNAFKGLCAFGIAFLDGLATGDPSSIDQEICKDINNVVIKWIGDFQKMLDAAKLDGSGDSISAVASLASAIAPAWSVAACLNMKLQGSGFEEVIWHGLREQCFELSMHGHVRQIPLRCLTCLYSEPLLSVVAPTLTSSSLEQSLSLWVVGACDELNIVAVSAAEAMRRVPQYGNYFLGMSFTSSRNLQVTIEGRIDCARSMFAPLGMKPGLAVKIVELLGMLPKVISRGITEAMHCKVPVAMCGVLAGHLLKYCSKPMMSFSEGVLLVRSLLSFLRLLHTNHFKRASKEIFSALPYVFDAVCEVGLSDGSRLQVLLDSVFGMLESASIRPASFKWAEERVLLDAANELKQLGCILSRKQAVQEMVMISVIPWFLHAQCSPGNPKMGVPSALLLMKEMLLAWTPEMAETPLAHVQQWGVLPSYKAVGGRSDRTAADLFQGTMLPLLMLLEDAEANDIKEPSSTIQARVAVFELVGTILEKASESHPTCLVPILSESSIHSKVWSCFLDFVGRMAVQTLLSTAVRKSSGHVAFSAASSDRLAVQRGRLREEKARWVAAKEKGSDILRKLGAQIPVSLDRSMLPTAFSVSTLERYHRATLKRMSLLPDPWENTKTRKVALMESSTFYLKKLAGHGSFGRGLVTQWLPLLAAGADIDTSISSNVQSLRHFMGLCRTGPLRS